MSNNNKWAGLSQSEKAQLISIYAKHGYTKLSNITNHYNQFDNGGDKKTIKDRIVDYYFNKTFNPYIENLGVEEVRRRLYDNIVPISYVDYKRRLKSALNGETSNYDKALSKYRDDSRLRDNIWAEYLQIPENERHNYEDATKISESNYSPTKTTNNNIDYKKIDLSPEEIESLIERGISGGYDLTKFGEQHKPTLFESRKTRDKIYGENDPLEIGENRVSETLAGYFGPHTIGRGLDPQRGEYVSYYDKWDLAPYKVYGEDESHGIGKPIEFYDRIYLNDYYGVNPEFDGYYGGYIQPAVVTGESNKFNLGGDESNEEYYDVIEPAIITPRISALNQARAYDAKPNTDFSNAQDMSLLSRIKANIALNSLSTAARKFIGLDPHTCLNTVTGFYGANVASNENLVKNPERYGYEEIQQNELLPGDLILLSNKDNKFTHATMFDSIADRHMIKYDYPVVPGDTLLNYSNGGVGIDNYRHEAPLSRFYDSEQSGGDFSGKKKYFRYIGKNKYEMGGPESDNYKVTPSPYLNNNPIFMNSWQQELIDDINNQGAPYKQQNADIGLLSNLIKVNPEDITEGKSYLYLDFNKPYKYKNSDDLYFGQLNKEFANDVNIDEYFEQIPDKEFKAMLPKTDYIGGTQQEVRLKYLEKFPELKEQIKKTAKLYGINPNILLTRLMDEGWIDYAIIDYNASAPEYQRDHYNYFIQNGVNGFQQMGLDDAGSFLAEGKLRLLNGESYRDAEGVNEKRRTTHSVITDNFVDALGIKAATMAYLRDELKKRGIKGSDLDVWINAAYNMGLYHKDLTNRDYILRKYSFNNYFE